MSRCTTSTASGWRAIPRRPRLDLGGFGAGDAGNNGPSRINDLNPDDIESIEIVEGSRRRHALRHSGLQRRRSDHHQARRGRPPPLEPVHRSRRGQRRERVSGQLLRPRIPRRIPTGSTGFCTIQSELDGLCTQSSAGPVPAAERARPPGPTRPACASSTASTCRAATRSRPTTSRASMRTRSVPTGFPGSRKTRSGKRAARCRATQIRPNALEKVSLRANVGSDVSQNLTSTPRLASSPAIPGSWRTTTAS